jgi:hypothetical protein
LSSESLSQLRLGNPTLRAMQLKTPVNVSHVVREAEMGRVFGGCGWVVSDAKR